MLCYQSTPKNYIRAEHKRRSISKLLIPQVSISQTATQILFTISERKPRKTIICFGTYSYSAGTQHGNCIQLCDLFYSVSLHRPNTGKTWEVFWKKMQVNGPDQKLEEKTDKNKTKQNKTKSRWKIQTPKSTRPKADVPH